VVASTRKNKNEQKSVPNNFIANAQLYSVVPLLPYLFPEYQ
jgi:hypothetical protein